MTNATRTGQTVRYTGDKARLGGLYAVQRVNEASITAVAYYDLSVHYLEHGDYLVRDEGGSMAANYAAELELLNVGGATATNIEAARRNTTDGQFRRLVIVPCGADKADEPELAAMLYTGALYRSAWKAADALRNADIADTLVLILSAKYGLIHPYTRVAPYDLRVGDDGAVGVREVRDQVLDLDLGDISEVVVLGSGDYAELVEAAFELQAIDGTPIPYGVRTPVAGLGGLGYMRSKLAAIADQAVVEPAPGTYKAKAPAPAEAPELEDGGNELTTDGVGAPIAYGSDLRLEAPAEAPECWHRRILFPRRDGNPTAYYRCEDCGLEWDGFPHRPALDAWRRSPATPYRCSRGHEWTYRPGGPSWAPGRTCCPTCGDLEVQAVEAPTEAPDGYIHGGEFQVDPGTPRTSSRRLEDRIAELASPTCADGMTEDELVDHFANELGL
ncbi:MAG: DUF6884 domain-containing protein [Phycisphaerales bacterium]